MEEKKFQSLMIKAKTMLRFDTTREHYWTGYMRGLRRAHHGERFGSEAEHELWLSLANDEIEERKQKGKGYRDGLAEGGMTL